jgi:hypothetical protein
MIKRMVVFFHAAPGRHKGIMLVDHALKRHVVSQNNVQHFEISSLVFNSRSHGQVGGDADVGAGCRLQQYKGFAFLFKLKLSVRLVFNCVLRQQATPRLEVFQQFVYSAERAEALV